MTFADELTKIRRYLRDPDGTIWSDAFIRHVYNDVQKDFANKTRLLFDVAVQRVPGVYQWSYMHDWEYARLPTTESQFYQCLTQHDVAVICHAWESQQITAMAGTLTDSGAHFTQPWEAYVLAPGEPVKMRFPANLNSIRFIAYDEEPIASIERKDAQWDQSYIEREGRPFGYYLSDKADNAYVLYPRPPIAWDDTLEGAAFHLSDDTEDATAGIIAVRPGSFDPDNGVPIDLISAVNNVFIVYEVNPADMESGLSESDYPAFALKYIRFGVIGRAYGGNNDGKIRSLSEYWMNRYAQGIRAVKRYIQKKLQDRQFTLMTRDVVPTRRYRHARLPDGYPAV